VVRVIEIGEIATTFVTEDALRRGNVRSAAMPFSDLALSRRLEGAEGYACAQYAEARRHLFPQSGAEWMEHAGAYAVFDGVESPITQTFGLGIFEELSPTALESSMKSVRSPE